MEKEIYELLYEVKSCFAKINVRGDDDPSCIEQYTDKGIRLLETLDQMLGDMFAKSNGGGIKEVVCREDGPKWKAVDKGNLPERLQDVLFYTVSGQVFEGFLETLDFESAHVGEDGRIHFDERADGGKWFRYRFRDLLPMDSVKAWRYKDTPKHVVEGLSEWKPVSVGEGANNVYEAYGTFFGSRVRVEYSLLSTPSPDKAAVFKVYDEDGSLLGTEDYFVLSSVK